MHTAGTHFERLGYLIGRPHYKVPLHQLKNYQSLKLKNDRDSYDRFILFNIEVVLY